MREHSASRIGIKVDMPLTYGREDGDPASWLDARFGSTSPPGAVVRPVDRWVPRVGVCFAPLHWQISGLWHSSFALAYPCPCLLPVARVGRACAGAALRVVDAFQLNSALRWSLPLHCVIWPRASVRRPGVFQRKHVGAARIAAMLESMAEAPRLWGASSSQIRPDFGKESGGLNYGLESFEFCDLRRPFGACCLSPLGQQVRNAVV
jgi:hypothetical protein